MTHIASFNDGIEAAKRRIKAEASRLRSQGLTEVADRMAAEADYLRALKRPEPSEAERVEKVAAVIERELMIDESLLADPATLRKIKSQRIARAALKAMGGGA